MRLRRRLLWGLLLLLFWSGCRGDNGDSSGNRRRITLEFWTLQMDAFKTTLDPMFRKYERLHPHVRVRWVDIPFSEGPKRTLAAVMSGHPPDVINLNPDFSALLASRGALADMNGALPERVRESYLPVAWQAATLNRGESPMAFGAPWYVTSSVLLYNRSLLSRAGFQAPPASFSGLPGFCEAIRRDTDAYGLMPAIAEHGGFLKELRKIGVPLYDARGRAVFASDMAVAHLSELTELYRNGWIPAETATEGHQAAVGRFQAGTLALLSIGPNFLKIVRENAPDVYRVTGVAPQFPAGAQYTDFALMLLAVPVKSVHPKEAADFAAFITNAENQMALAKAAPVLPSVTRALKDPYFSASGRSGDLLEQGRRISAAQLLRATHAYPVQPDQHAIDEVIDHAVQWALLGKKTPMAALRDAQREVNDILTPISGGG